jgi:hypothetical protein
MMNPQEIDLAQGYALRSYAAIRFLSRAGCPWTF